MGSHVVGYPRIGPKRELKFALESFWESKISADELQRTGHELRVSIWRQMLHAAVDFIPSNTFSFYDQVLDTTAMVGAVPERYGWTGGEVSLETYFAMARGSSKQPAMEMTKWFDTNYHYIVPELCPEMEFQLSSKKAIKEFQEALAIGIQTVPVILGPFTYLMLGKPLKNAPSDFDRLILLPKLILVYMEILKGLADSGARWIQIDEPALVLDLESNQISAFKSAYSKILSEFSVDKKSSSNANHGGVSITDTSSNPKILLQTYFDEIPRETYKAIIELKGIQGLGLDLVRGTRTLHHVRDLGLPDGVILFAGVIDGRNIWINDLEKSLNLVQDLEKLTGNKKRLVVSTSCSLQHTAVNLASEEEGIPTVDSELRSWMAFASQKVKEVVALGSALKGDIDRSAFEKNAKALATRRDSPRVHNQIVKEKVVALGESHFFRATKVEERLAKQQKKLKLPLFPTTTIGSFPQTPDIRRVRRDYKNKKISHEEYVEAIHKEIESVVNLQVELGLDILVHGEPERNDMVEYFGEQLEGFGFTKNGWVQSYGSRCVKPPVIFGDVSRPIPMTTSWSKYAQKIAEPSGKSVKGMLTGPVTILNWSFVRNDQPRSETCLQIALAIQDEVQDLEAAGIDVIQIDEAALREGLPLRKSQQKNYLDWAVKSFRITTTKVKDDTQIHTHMCYSNFNDIMPSIVAMDADVITIENSRSDEKLLMSFREGGIQYSAGIGPGVYDIHSPRIPSVQEMSDRILKILGVLDKKVVWVNPDCGLKTRKYDEVHPALHNMVEASKKIRAQFASSQA